MARGTTKIAAVSKTNKRRREQKAGPSMAELRPLLWKRCGGRCEFCGITLDFETFEAHHRKFRSRGGLDRIENLVALCADCHHWAHSEGTKATKTGFAVPSVFDPATVPVNIGAGLPVYLTAEGTYTRKAPS